MDDVRLFARAAISNPQPPRPCLRPSCGVSSLLTAVHGGSSRSSRSTARRPVRESSPRRPSRDAPRVHRLQSRPSRRARSRHLCDAPAPAAAGVIESEMPRLQVIVDKTAGEAELEAMALLAGFVRTAAVLERSVPMARGPRPGPAAPTQATQAGSRDDDAAGRGGVRRDSRAAAFRSPRSARRRGRWFGGIGAAAPAPTLLLSATRAETIEVTGEDAERAAEFASRFLTHHGLDRRIRLHVHRALPRNVGLGSGTQLALAVARALAEMHGLSTDPRGLARAVGRARRSAIGTWTFADGGLVVEGGRHPDRDECGPLVSRLPFPPDWRCVLAVPDADGRASAVRRKKPPLHRFRSRPCARSSGWRTSCS